MTERQHRLQNWIHQVSPKYGLKIGTLRKASTDASFRHYYRIDGEQSTYIVMDAPPPQENVKSFIQVDRLMLEAGVNAPVIFEKDEEAGFLLLSDLGTKTYLEVIDLSNANRLMDDAIDTLIRWQMASKPGVLPEYDSALLRRELELFPEWYLGKHCGITLSTAERAMFDKVFERIVRANSEQSQVFVHRDYMPRNLMWTEVNNPGVLDFQDAVFGPVSYDIACLFKDAFLSWDESLVIDWTIRYWEKARKAGIPVPGDFGQFWRDIEWMGLQRHLKVLGIFARISYRDGKPKYLADTPRFLDYVRPVVHRYDELKPLAQFIDGLEGRQTITSYTF